jgi:hypothetical protein
VLGTAAPTAAGAPFFPFPARFAGCFAFPARLVAASPEADFLPAGFAAGLRSAMAAPYPRDGAERTYVPGVADRVS